MDFKKIKTDRLNCGFKRSLSPVMLCLTLGLFVVKSIYASDYDFNKFERSLPFENLPNGLKQDYFQEKERYENALKRLEEQRLNLRTQLEMSLMDLSLASEQRNKIVGYFSDHIRQPINAIAANDLFVANQLQKLAFEKDSIFLAIGNPYLNYSSSENALARNDMIHLLEGLKQREVFVVYDADATAAKYIEHYISSTSRLGISGALERTPIHRGTILVIKNPYLRLKTVLSFKHTVLSPDSLLSAGLLITGLKLDEYEIRYPRQFYVLDSVAMKTGLSQWAELLKKQTPVKIEVEGSVSRAPAPYYWNNPWYFSSHSQPVAPKKDRNWFSLLKRKKKPTPPAVTIHHAVAQAPRVETPKARDKSSEEKTDVADKDEVRSETFSSSTFKSSEPKIKNFPEFTEFRNLGIAYPNQDNVLVVNALSLAPKLPFAVRKRAPEINLASIYIDQALVLLKKAEIRLLINQSDEYASKSSQLNSRFQSKRSHSRGAVFFGSGKGCSHFESLVSDCVREVAKKGLPISTGGEGGFMELANSVARSESVLSIGIILDRFGYRRYEDRDTIAVSNYEQRIPLLLEDRSLVMVGPGGPGTMKEVGTYFTKMSAEKEYNPLVFISAEYFNGFFDWLERLSLPEEFISQVVLVGSVKEMKTFMSN